MTPVLFLLLSTYFVAAVATSPSPTCQNVSSFMHEYSFIRVQITLNVCVKHNMVKTSPEIVVSLHPCLDNYNDTYKQTNKRDEGDVLALNLLLLFPPAHST